VVLLDFSINLYMLDNKITYSMASSQSLVFGGILLMHGKKLYFTDVADTTTLLWMAGRPDSQTAWHQDAKNIMFRQSYCWHFLALKTFLLTFYHV
jgi:hypothetical protein